jgi:hypothetical protein
LITLCASASAATVHHSRQRVIVRYSQGWGYAAPRPPTDHDGTPSYNDPSKFGGDTALAATPSAVRRQTSVNYCIQYDYGGDDCSFTSKAECEATASGQGAECYRNYYGKDGWTLQW